MTVSRNKIDVLSYLKEEESFLMLFIFSIVAIICFALDYWLHGKVAISTISGIIIGLAASSLFAVFSHAVRKYANGKNFTEFSRFISGSKFTLNVSFVIPTYQISDECIAILNKNNIEYANCFKKPLLDESGNPVLNQKKLLAISDIESITDISNFMWEIFNIVPSIKDDEEVLTNLYSHSNIHESQTINYISIGLYGNAFTTKYCNGDISAYYNSKFTPLFKLSPHARGECSIIVNDKPYKQITYYPPGKEMAPVDAQGIDYGLVAKHYFKPKGLSKSKCAWWFFGGLSGAGTEAAGVYFRSHYDELVGTLKDVCRGKNIDSRDVNFVLLIAVDRNFPKHPFPYEIHIFDGEELLYSRPLISKANKKIIKEIKRELKKE